MTNNNDGGVSVSRRPLPPHVPGPRLGPRDIALRNERYRWFVLGHCWLPLTVHGVPVLLKCVEPPGDLGLFPETANAPLTGPTAMPAAAAQTVRNKQMRFLTLCHLLFLPPITPHFAPLFRGSYANAVWKPRER
jgi:hypothetical protein